MATPHFFKPGSLSSLELTTKARPVDQPERLSDPPVSTSPALRLECEATPNIFMWAQASTLLAEFSLQTCLFKDRVHIAQASMELTFFSCLYLLSAEITEPVLNLSPMVSCPAPSMVQRLSLVQQIPNLLLVQVVEFLSQLPALGFLLWLVSAPGCGGHRVSTPPSTSASSRKSS